MKVGLSSIAALLCFVCSPISAAAQTSAAALPPKLKGAVHKDSASRLPRPLLDAKKDFAMPAAGQSPMQSNLSAFSSPASLSSQNSKNSLLDGGTADDTVTKGLSGAEKMKEDPGIKLQSGTKHSRAATGSNDTEPSGPALKPAVSRKILIRLKRFHSLSETEVVWEAARAARRWLNKGADVSILLDMDAIHAANKNETAGAWYEKNRGNGNETAEKLSTPQDELLTFVQSGGKLYASERWVKLGAISSAALISGTTLLSEDQMDDLLIDPSYTIMSY